MRRGSTPATRARTKSAKAYGRALVYERPRHRFEFNNGYRERMQEPASSSAALSRWPPREMMSCATTPVVATQAHPELKSRPPAPTRSSATSCAS